MNSISVTLPLPSNVLGKNQGHGHWFGRNRAVRDHATLGTNAIRQALPRDHEPWTGPVIVTIRWFGRGGPLPDVDNIIARCCAYTDASQHAGLLADDKQITDFVVERDYDRDEPRVELTFACAAEEG